MIQFCFNELSSIPLCRSKEEIEERVSLYVATIKAARSSLDLNKIRYPGLLDKVALSEDTSLQDYCNENVKDPKSILLLSTHTMPQVDDGNDVILSNYLDADTTVEIDGADIPADGFNAGFCQGAPCIGFASPRWRDDVIYNIAITSGGSTSYVRWGCLSTPAHICLKSFVDWYSTISPIELICSSFRPNQKDIKIRKDHGYDILLEHAKSLINCCYVVGIVNSLPFNPHCKSYIHKVFDNGYVDVVLFWYDQGYSMRIQTTGRNIRESEKIALYLKDKYGH